MVGVVAYFTNENARKASCGGGSFPAGKPFVPLEENQETGSKMAEQMKKSSNQSSEQDSCQINCEKNQFSSHLLP